MNALPLLSEADVAALLTPEDALREMRAVFAAMAEGTTQNFPVVRERLADGATIFGIKSAVHPVGRTLGLKAGGYFPRASGGGHQSAIVLFDLDSGALQAVVSGNLITRLRTAAAAALSIDLLARADSRVLAVIGSGAQAEAHVRAALAVRPFTRVVLFNRSAPRAHALADRLTDLPAAIEVEVDVRAAVMAADVVITLTPATQPIVESAWVRPGTHLACMGADTVGKQEVTTELVHRARVYTDSLPQAVTIGECQTVARLAPNPPWRGPIGTLGDLLLGRIEGRLGGADVTLFDGTGVAAQDLAMAALALQRQRQVAGR